jgi:hypothetical protein
MRVETKRATALWTIQVLLAMLFLFAGGLKLATPARVLEQQAHLPGAFLHFIGVAEVAGALGLLLPRLLHIRPGLTPLAAAGLVVIMVGATVVTLASGQVVPALLPAIVGTLAAIVAWSRFREQARPPAPLQARKV